MTKGRSGSGGRGNDDRQRRQRDETQVDREHARHDLHVGPAAVAGTLVEMGAVRLPEAGSGSHAPQQRRRRIGDEVERQQQRRGKMAGGRDEEQEPADKQADRQAADIAEKQLRDRAVEGRKAEHRPQKRERDDERLRRQGAEHPDDGDAERDRHDLGDHHPIDAVHEVHEIDEPDAADDHESALEPERQRRQDVQVGGQRAEHHADGNGLGDQPRRKAEHVDIVGCTHDGKQERRAHHRE